MNVTLLTGRAASLSDAAGRSLRSTRRWTATVAGAYRRLGVPGVAVALAGRLPRRVLNVQWYDFLQTIPPGDPSVPLWEETRVAGPDDLGALAGVGRAGAEELRARLAGGDRAYLASDGGRPLGYVWYRSGRWREDDTEFALADDERWGYDSFIAPTDRGRRIGPGMAAYALADLQRLGVHRVLAVIDRLNESSARAARRYGARPIARFLTVAVAGLVIVHERRLADGRGRWTLHLGSAPILRRPPAGPRPSWEGRA